MEVKMKKIELVYYLVDCKGYDFDEMQECSMSELRDLIDDWEDYKNY
jgi:hypothetical protein